MNLRRKARRAVGSRHARKTQRHSTKQEHPGVSVQRKFRELVAKQAA